MSHEWKPGDVAMVTVLNGTSHRAMYQGHNRWACGVMPGSCAVSDARPLVVIDSEDREQTERLAKAYIATWEGATAGETTESITTRQMQAALREFADAKPPKPAEPAGLGAVVEDANGRRWVRWTQREELAPWTHSDPNLARFSYDGIDVVRVLSAGVSA